MGNTIVASNRIIQKWKSFWSGNEVLVMAYYLETMGWNREERI
jgi:hypothetical protein